MKLSGLDITSGGGWGPSGPRSNRASHRNSARLCVLSKVTLMVEDTLSGNRITLMSQPALLLDQQPLILMEPKGPSHISGEKNKSLEKESNTGCKQDAAKKRVLLLLLLALAAEVEHD